MKKFNIYTHEILPTEVVREGWGWPAFFFNTFWALAKKMWGVFFFSWVLYIFAYLIALIIFSSDLDFNEFSKADIVPVVFMIFFGAYGNSWRVDKLIKKGYMYADTINAKNYKSALSKYRAKAPSTEQESSAKANEKITSSTGIKLDSDNIPSKKKGDSSSIKEKSSDKSKTKDIEPKEIQKPVTSHSVNDSEYVEKLKEAKSLLDDELINKADYEKIKKKIIDSF